MPSYKFHKKRSVYTRLQEEPIRYRDSTAPWDAMLSDIVLHTKRRHLQYVLAFYYLFQRRRPVLDFSEYGTN